MKSDAKILVFAGEGPINVGLTFPKSCWLDDPEGYRAYFTALQEMANRMAMSHAKYQQRAVPPTMEAAVEGVDEMASARHRMAMYDGKGVECDCSFNANGSEDGDHQVSCKLMLKPLNTGNTENLLDASNMLVIERIFPKHAKAHFKSQKSSDSPGLSFQE